EKSGGVRSGSGRQPVFDARAASRDAPREELRNREVDIDVLAGVVFGRKTEYSLEFLARFCHVEFAPHSRDRPITARNHPGFERLGSLGGPRGHSRTFCAFFDTDDAVALPEVCTRLARRSCERFIEFDPVNDVRDRLVLIEQMPVTAGTTDMESCARDLVLEEFFARAVGYELPDIGAQVARARERGPDLAAFENEHVVARACGLPGKPCARRPGPDDDEIVHWTEIRAFGQVSCHFHLLLRSVAR